MDERCYYLYAITWANCSAAQFGPGVDPRFAVELARSGQVAGLTSRVGLDRFDVGKLQTETTDLKWLSEVAVRHNEIVAELARHGPVLPLRMGTLFESRASLLARLAQYEARVVDFLRRLSNRQEWAVKVYLDPPRAEEPQGVFQKPPLPLGEGRGEGASNRPGSSVHNTGSPVPLTLTLSQRERQRSTASSQGTSQGTQYLAARRLHGERRQQAQVVARRAVQALEARLQTLADSWQQLRPLPAALTGRAEKMVYHGALLVSDSCRQAFRAACEDLRRRLAREGLILEVSGPWPPYHFCPALEP